MIDIKGENEMKKQEHVSEHNIMKFFTYKRIILSLILLITIPILNSCKENNSKEKLNNLTTDSQSEWIFSHDSIERTLSQIDSLENKLIQNETELLKEIASLKQLEPIFANQGMFESTIEYEKRIQNCKAIIDSVRSKYINNDIWNRLSILRANYFKTDSINVTLGTYNPDRGIYPLTITHLNYQKEVINTNISIVPEKAELLYNNIKQIKKTGILTLGIDNKVNLAIVQIEHPIYEIYYQFEIQPLLNIDQIYTQEVFTFSPTGRFIAIKTSLKIFVIDLLQKNRREHNLFGYSHYDICFSKNNKFVVAFSKDPSGAKYLVYDQFKNEEIEDFFIKKGTCYFKTGDYMFTLDENRVISPDGKYRLVSNNHSVDVYRTSILEESTSFIIIQVYNDEIAKQNILFEIKSKSDNNVETSPIYSEEYRKNKFLNSTIDEIDSRGTGLSIEEINWLYEEAKKQGYCD